MTFIIRPIQERDIPHVVAIERQAFPDDPWTPATWQGALSRATRDGQARHAAATARLIRFSRAQQAMNLIRLTRLVKLNQPPEMSYIVAEADNGEITGYGSMLSAGDGDASIPMLAVRPGYQGRKTGTQLLMKLIAMAMADGCDTMSLYVRADNHGAQRLYRRTGFTETGIRPCFYQPSGTDAIMMRLRLRLSVPGPHLVPETTVRKPERMRSDYPFGI